MKEKTTKILSTTSIATKNGHKSVSFIKIIKSSPKTSSKDTAIKPRLVRGILFDHVVFSTPTTFGLLVVKLKGPNHRFAEGKNAKHNAAAPNSMGTTLNSANTGLEKIRRTISNSSVKCVKKSARSTMRAQFILRCAARKTSTNLPMARDKGTKNTINAAKAEKYCDVKYCPN